VKYQSPRIVTSAYRYSFVKFISSTEYILSLSVLKFWGKGFGLIVSIA